MSRNQLLEMAAAWGCPKLISLEAYAQGTEGESVMINDRKGFSSS